jgi:adenine-specific DNA-methyltransferase
MSLVEMSEQLRSHVAVIPRSERSKFGQFMTPSHIARYIASLFLKNSDECRLLDPGAGLGSLTCAFLERTESDNSFFFKKLEICSIEADAAFAEQLRGLLQLPSTSQLRESDIVEADFIPIACDWIAAGSRSFTHAILNPPYKKLAASSEHRLLLKSVGIEAVNLYSAFVGLAIKLLSPGGQLVAIIPRSFCNGPYYEAFREQILESCAIAHIHLFEARDKAFGEDSVLQENVIISLLKGGEQGEVEISTSRDGSFSDLSLRRLPFEEVVQSSDRDRFIRIPISRTKRKPYAGCPLGEVGLEVSTGPVVEFRLRQHSLQLPGPDSVPLLYPSHFRKGRLEWPNSSSRKPNAISVNDETWKWLYPSGFYVVVRRFSSKEEGRRIVASVVDPREFSEYDYLAFENRLNVFHLKRRGLDEALAYGLASYLNSQTVDDEFRSFNGHTQVNATDLRKMLYPSLTDLRQLGASEISKRTQQFEERIA